MGVSTCLPRTFGCSRDSARLSTVYEDPAEIRVKALDSRSSTAACLRGLAKIANKRSIMIIAGNSFGSAQDRVRLDDLLDGAVRPGSTDTICSSSSSASAMSASSVFQDWFPEGPTWFPVSQAWFPGTSTSSRLLLKRVKRTTSSVGKSIVSACDQVVAATGIAVGSNAYDMHCAQHITISSLV